MQGGGKGRTDSRVIRDELVTMWKTKLIKVKAGIF